MHGQRKIKTQTNEVQRIWETICENHPYYHYFQIKVQIIFNITMLYDFSDEINTSFAHTATKSIYTFITYMLMPANINYNASITRVNT